MAEDRPREIELYTCNKYAPQSGADVVTFCNAPQYCDPETKQRRHCVMVKVIVQGASFSPG